MNPIRFDSKAQIERIKKAATLRKWSFNRFVVEAADKMAAQSVETGKVSEQLTEPSEPTATV